MECVRLWDGLEGSPVCLHRKQVSWRWKLREKERGGSTGGKGWGGDRKREKKKGEEGEERKEKGREGEVLRPHISF